MNTFYVRLLIAFLLANFVVLGISVLGTRALLHDEPRIEFDLDAVHALVRESYRQKGAAGVRALNERYRKSGLFFAIYEDGRPTSKSLPRPLQDFADRISMTKAETYELPHGGEFLHSVPLGDVGDATNVTIVTHQRDTSKRVGGGPGSRDRPPGSRGGPPGPGRQDEFEPNTDETTLLPATTPVTFIVYLVLLSIGIALAGWVVARNLTAPLRSVQTTINRFAHGDLSARVGAHLAERGDDMGRLAGDFDRMANGVEEMIEGRDRLLHQLSHEMRSPLARLRFAIELARGDENAKDSYLQRADTEVDRLDRLMDEMLQMARAERLPNERPLQLMELNGLLQDALARASIDAQVRDVRLSLEAGSEVTFAGQTEALERAIDNVLRNAVKFSPVGGDVRVSGGLREGMVVIEVADEGHGVPAAELSALFEPFYRASNSTAAEGYGLGLAIVASAMRAHGGQADARNRDGSGLVVRMRFPHRSTA